MPSPSATVRTATRTRCSCGPILAQTEPELTTTVTIPGTVIAADDTDIWYGLGHFTISANAEVEIAQGRVVRVITTTIVFDIYDCHAGLAAGGEDEVVAGSQDAWAAWLVDQGEACELEMGTERPRPQPNNTCSTPMPRAASSTKPTRSSRKPRRTIESSRTKRVP